MPSSLPKTRCALTAPFHPYRGQNATQPRRSVLCGTVPEASPREGSGPAGRYPAPFVHGARTFLPAPPFGIGAERPSGRLTRIGMGCLGQRVKPNAVTWFSKKWPGPAGEERQARASGGGQINLERAVSRAQRPPCGSRFARSRVAIRLNRPGTWANAKPKCFARCSVCASDRRMGVTAASGIGCLGIHGSVSKHQGVGSKAFPHALNA